MNNNCKICGADVTPVFNATVLKKYPVTYFQCNECKFMQTDKPFWLEESYSSAITFLDIGLITRNIKLSEITSCIIDIAFNADAKFIDYAGGYGMFVRLMRDKGYNYFRQDKYCENLFAKSFDIEDIQSGNNEQYELLTAFEIFEHLEDPLEEIKKMKAYSNNILFSTELQPQKTLKDPTDWWYIAAETGQHIAFYTEKSLNIIAQKLGLKYYKISDNLHLFSDKNVNIKWISAIENNSKLRFLYKKLIQKKHKSLLQSDYNNIIGRKVL